MPKFTSVVGSLKPTQLEGERRSLYGAFYWTVKEKGQARECIFKVDWLSLLTVNIPLSSEHRPFSSLAGLTTQVKIFTKTSTAGCVPGTGATTKATRPYGPDGVTVEQMAFLEPGNGVFLPEWKRQKRDTRCKGNERGVTCQIGRGGQSGLPPSVGNVPPDGS